MAAPLSGLVILTFLHIIFRTAEACVNIDIPIQEHNTPSGSWINVFLDYTFDCNTTVQGWEYHASETGTFFATVWRPSQNGDKITLIGKNRITTHSTGPQTADVPDEEMISVLSGDVIGVHYTDTHGAGVVPYEQSDLVSTTGFTVDQLSRIFNADMDDSRFPVGVTWSVSRYIVPVKRLPALKPITTAGGGNTVVNNVVNNIVAEIDDDLNYVSHETRLLGDLLNGYNKMAIPLYNSSTNVTVTISLIPVNLIELNEKSGYMSTLYWVYLTWYDLRLRWNESEYGNLYSIRISADKIWFPDIKPYNSARKDVTSEKSGRDIVNVYPGGMMAYLPTVNFETTCDFDMHHFPYDVQECEVRLGSWTYDGSVVDLQLSSPGFIDLSSFNPNHAWDLVSATSRRNVQIYDCCPEPYIDIVYTFRLRRRPGFFRDLYVIPSVLLASLVPFVFALPVTRVHRYVLGGFLLLVFTQLLMAFDSNIPTTNGGTPLLGQLFACLQALVAISLLVSAALNNLATRKSSHIPPPGFVQTIIVGYLGRLLRISRSEPSVREPQEDSDDVALSSTVSSTWLTVAQIVDRLFFLIYCVVYLIMAIAFAAV